MEQQDYQNYKDYIEQIDLQRYWLVIKRRWVPALVVTCLSIAGAVHVATDDDTVYQATGQVFIKGRDPAATLTGVAPELATQEGMALRNDIDQVSVLATQQELMRSTVVLEAVVEALDLKTAEGTPINPGKLRSGLSTEPIANTSIVRVSYQSPDPEMAAAVVNALMDAYIDLNIENNRTEARAAREFIEEELPRARQTVEQAADALQAFRVRNNIVNLEQESIATVDLLRGIEATIVRTRADLADFTARVTAYQEQLGLSAEQAKQLAQLGTAQTVQQILGNLSEVQNQLAIQGARYTDNHPVIANLQRQQAALLALLDEQVQIVVGEVFRQEGENYEFSPLEVEITTDLIQSEAQRQAYASSVAELERRRIDYIQRSDVLPTLQRQELQLLNDLEAAQAEYDLLLTRLQEVRLAENQTVGTAQIQEQATVPGRPVVNRSRQMKLLVAGIAGGLLSGIAVAFLLDLLDKSIKTTKDAEALLGYPLLGLIPKFATRAVDRNATLNPAFKGLSPRLVTLLGTNPAIAAAYQMLQANLKFIRTAAPPHTIVVSSAVEQEGKSEICANLAVAIAQVGRRVMLVDANLRSPVQHHLWQVLSPVGLSQVLMGEGELEAALHAVADNLTLLPAGLVPTNPLALLDSERMQQLLATLATQYDYVIVDTPPLVGAADAAVLGQQADGIVWVVRPRRVEVANALAAKALLQRAEVSVLGLVSNAVILGNEHDDHVSMTRSQFAAPRAWGKRIRWGKVDPEKESVP